MFFQELREFFVLPVEKQGKVGHNGSRIFQCSNGGRGLYLGGIVGILSGASIVPNRGLKEISRALDPQGDVNSSVVERCREQGGGTRPVILLRVLAEWVVVIIGILWVSKGFVESRGWGRLRCCRERDRCRVSPGWGQDGGFPRSRSRCSGPMGGSGGWGGFALGSLSTGAQTGGGGGTFHTELIRLM